MKSLFRDVDVEDLPARGAHEHLRVNSARQSLELSSPSIRKGNLKKETEKEEVNKESEVK